MSVTGNHMAGVRDRATAAIRQQIVLKFNNTGCEERCTLCGTPFDVPLGVAAFIAGGYDPVCDACVQDRAPGLLALVGLSFGSGDPLHRGFNRTPELDERGAVHLANGEIRRLRTGLDRLRATLGWVHPDPIAERHETPAGSPFGNCPVCGAGGIGHDVGGTLYNACDTHRICWPIGNSIGLARDAMRSEWSDDELKRHYAKNRAKLQSYQVIEAREAVPSPVKDEVPWEDAKWEGAPF
jgi:hypothetical protein